GRLGSSGRLLEDFHCLPSPGLRMKSTGLEANAIEAFIDGDVQHVAVIADAELHVAGNSLPVLKKPGLLRRPRGEKYELLAGVVDYHDARTSQAADCQVEVPVRIHAHTVAAVFLAEIDQRPSRSVH